MTSPTYSVRPKQQAPRSGNPQPTQEPASRLSDEESEGPAGKGSLLTPPTTRKHPVASTGPSGPCRTVVRKYHLSGTTVRSWTGSAQTRNQEATPGATGTDPDPGSHPPVEGERPPTQGPGRPPPTPVWEALDTTPASQPARQQGLQSASPSTARHQAQEGLTPTQDQRPEAQDQLPAEQLKDISDVIDSLKQRPAVVGASHLMYAYRIKAGRNITENFHSDEDHGVGLELLRHMQDNELTNWVYIATRDCSATFKHIGTKRFDHVISLCRNASDNITTE